VITNLPKEINATEILDNFEIGDVDASEDTLLKNEFCICKIQPIRDFLKGNKSIVLGHRGAGKTALFRLISEGVLNFEGSDNEHHITLTIDDELQFHAIHETIRERVKNVEGSMWLTYRFLWEFFILYRVIMALDEKFLSVEPIKSMAVQFRELFEGKLRKTTLADFIKGQKKTVGIKIDQSLTGLPIPDLYFAAEPISEVMDEDYFDNSIVLNLGEYKRKINEFLKSKNTALIILIDKLDDFVLLKEYEIQKSIIQGLLHCERDYLGLNNLKLKIFLRTDIFRNLDFRKLMWEKVSSRTIELQWSDEDIRDFISKRIAYNFMKGIKHKRLYFNIDEDQMYIDESSGDSIIIDDEKTFFTKLLRWMSRKAKRDKYNARLVNLDDTINKALICTIFPRKIDHKNKQGSTKPISFFKYLSDHFNLSNNQTTPRIILMFLDLCISKNKEYYYKNIDQNTLHLDQETGEYPLLKREKIFEAYCCLQEDLWDAAAKISDKWENWVNILSHKKKQGQMSYSFMKQIIAPKDCQELNHFLAFMTHIGVLNCKTQNIPYEKRSYSVPIIFKKSFPGKY
jgi:hypothetical protein